MLSGHDANIATFLAAWRSGRMHHGWLLAGPRGVGKGLFARLAAARILAEASGTPVSGDGLAVPDDHPTARLLAAGSHMDFRLLERLEKKEGELARNISVDQVRQLLGLMDMTPALGSWRVVVVDSVDDLEANAANALLKMLEEPPANTIFLLVSHAPGRLLPTIRSRCRTLRFDPLGEETVASLLRLARPDVGEAAIIASARAAAGSIGRAIEIEQHGLAALEQEAEAIIADGDPTNRRRSALASALSGKPQAERYAAFLAHAPTLLARAATRMDGAQRARALAAHAEASEVARIAPRLSLDAGATIFRIGNILASVAAPIEGGAGPR